MDKLLHGFESVIIYAVILMLMIVIALTTAELGWLLIQDIIAPPTGLLEIAQLLDLFGFFLLILIGVELLESVKAYLDSHVVRVEIVLEIAIIAVARKVIILDLENYSSTTVIALAALLAGIGAAIYLIKGLRKGVVRGDPPLPVQTD